MNWEEKQKFLEKLPGYVILVQKPNDPVLYGIVENSWSLDVEPNRAFLYWTARETNGFEWATKDLNTFSRSHPEWTFTCYDARDTEKLPVNFNWDLWLDAHQPSEQTFSGVKNKHEARNLRFTLKGQPENVTKVADPLKLKISRIQFPTPVLLNEAIGVVRTIEQKH